MTGKQKHETSQKSSTKATILLIQGADSAYFLA
jgi:hypothetical protein